MRKASISIAVVFCVSAFCIISCRKKDKDVVVPATAVTTATNTLPPTIYHPPATDTTSDKSKLNTLFSAFHNSPQVINVTAGVPQVVICNKGTKLTFYSNSFKDAAGNTITSGTVTLKVVEMYKPGQMIAERAGTTSGNELLVSGGQINITATMGGAEVYAGKYGIGFKQPVSSTQAMSLFYGNTSNADSVTVWGSASTAAGTTAPGTISTSMATAGIYALLAREGNYKPSNSIYIVQAGPHNGDTSSGGGWGGTGGGGSGGTPPGGTGIYYQFDSCTNFHWINCDHFRGAYSTKTTISAIVSDTGFTAANTQTFFIFPSDNSVADGRSKNLPSLSFSFGDVPMGLTVTVIVMANKNGIYYYSENPGITVAKDLSVPVTMTVQSLSYIRGRLGAL